MFGSGAAMVRVIACVADQHNLWLVALAALIAASACAGVFYVLHGLAAVGRNAKHQWLFLAALIAGGGTWATHFVAMLGYNPGVALGFDLSLTLWSAAICIAGAWTAFLCLDRHRGSPGVIGAGVLLGSSIAGMHYVGALGLEAAAQRVWAPNLVSASVCFSITFALSSLIAFRHLPARHGRVAAPALLALAIVSLHFTAMGALTLIPDPTMVAPESTLDHHMLALTIATVAIAALLIGMVLAFSDRRVALLELVSARHAATLALHDSLTGLPNRRHIDEELGRRLDGGARNAFAVVAIDLDRFKPVNDLYGHAAGDELLIRVSRSLQGEAGEDGFAARLGGDEFLLLIPAPSHEALIARLAGLVSRFEEPMLVRGNEVILGASVGVALAPGDGLDGEALMRRADVALYRAKANGRGQFAFFELGMERLVEQRAHLERDLRVALRNGGIVPHFQPLVDLQSGAIDGYEILARWPRSDGAVAPDEFIPLAEDTGLIGELTLHILRKACTAARDWAGAPRLSLNISPMQLRDPLLAQKLLGVLTECGFPPGRIEIEVTETALVANYDEARAMLLSFKNQGMHIALDDFGTGYSSLRHLRELPFDVLKIDRSFVSGMSDNPESKAIVKTIIDLAANLGLGVIAEGIETADHADELRALGCKLGQGFHFGRPSPDSVNSADAAPRLKVVAA